MTSGRSASVLARLLTRAKAQGEDFNLVLGRYAAERLLYRLSISDFRERFWLKGALLITLWFETPHRPTRDVDLLGFGPEDPDAVMQLFRAVCAIDADDGIRFEANSVVVEPIREAARYGGFRIRLTGRIGNARCPVQVDVGYGDAVTSGPVETVLPALLPELPSPKLLAYPKVTVVAEKLEAAVQFGMANSRMKDYFDLLVLALDGQLDDRELAKAISATFTRRGTPIPSSVPLGLSPEFGSNAAKGAQWRGFLAKNRLAGPDLPTVVEEVWNRFGAAIRMAGAKS